jgi:hypothetical protein
MRSWFDKSTTCTKRKTPRLVSGGGQMQTKQPLLADTTKEVKKFLFMLVIVTTKAKQKLLPVSAIDNAK